MSTTFVISDVEKLCKEFNENVIGSINDEHYAKIENITAPLFAVDDHVDEYIRKYTKDADDWKKLMISEIEIQYNERIELIRQNAQNMTKNANIFSDIVAKFFSKNKTLLCKEDFVENPEYEKIVCSVANPNQLCHVCDQIAIDVFGQELYDKNPSELIHIGKIDIIDLYKNLASYLHPFSHISYDTRHELFDIQEEDEFHVIHFNVPHNSSHKTKASFTADIIFKFGKVTIRDINYKKSEDIIITYPFLTLNDGKEIQLQVNSSDNDWDTWYEYPDQLTYPCMTDYYSFKISFNGEFTVCISCSFDVIKCDMYIKTSVVSDDIAIKSFCKPTGCYVTFFNENLGVELS